MTLLLLWEEYRAEHPDGYGLQPVLRTLRRVAVDEALLILKAGVLPPRSVDRRV